MCQYMPSRLWSKYLDIFFHFSLQNRHVMLTNEHCKDIIAHEEVSHVEVQNKITEDWQTCVQFVLVFEKEHQTHTWNVWCDKNDSNNVVIQVWNLSNFSLNMGFPCQTRSNSFSMPRNIPVHKGWTTLNIVLQQWKIVSDYLRICGSQYRTESLEYVSSNPIFRFL